MILIKNRLIFGIIRRAITVVLKLIYGVIKLLNLQVVLLVGMIGLVLFLTGALSANSTLLIMYVVAVVITVALTVIFSLRKIFKSNKPKKSRGIDIMPNDTVKGEETYERETRREYSYREVEPERQAVSEVIASPPVVIEETPKYYAVKGHYGYYMAEYSDRIELYKKTDSGLKKIRTDYKN